MGDKIGIPIVTSYGSSYGTYGGSRLKDYKSPKDTSLNNKDAKGVNEFNDFNSTIRDYVLAKLGHPVIDVELDDFQIQICLDEAKSKLEYHAPDWMTQYATFSASLLLRLDFAVMFFTNTGLFNNYNVSQYLLMQQYLKQVKNVLGQMATWQLVNNKYLHLWPKPESNGEAVLLEFRAFDPTTLHHAYKSWLQRYTLALSKEILGGIRGKYQTLPGPGGGTRLNGNELAYQAKDEKEMLIEELLSSIEAPPLFDIF